MQETPIENYLLLNIWVPMELKMKILMEKVTPVIDHFDRDHSLSNLRGRKNTGTV